MTPIVDSLRHETASGQYVSFTCPECLCGIIQAVQKPDDEGSLIVMLPHDDCKASNVLIRVR